jgi:hypothetical protein
MRYTTIFLANSGVTGAFSILLLFFFCFLCVHIAKYAKIGWQSQNKKTVSKKPPEAPPPKQEKPAEQSEPIYYIVEKKKARAKHRYSEPREIRFK